VELLVVLRGVEPFSQLFVAASYKRAQFEAFDEISGARVGTFSPDTEDELPGTKLAGAGHRARLVVLKATLARHPLAVSPDQVDVGLVQVSYTLA
jgi:hypothetical protein